MLFFFVVNKQLCLRYLTTTKFKHVVASALWHYRDRTAWGRAVQQVATEYREQVLLDFQCFKKYAEKRYPSLVDTSFAEDDD